MKSPSLEGLFCALLRHALLPLAVQSSYHRRVQAREAAINEAEIIAQVLAGDAEAYGALVRAHEAYLYPLCLAILAHPQDAEEAAQVAFIKAYRSLARFRMGSSFRTWLTRIAINQCKDMLRQRRRRGLSLDAMLEAEAPLPKALVQEPRLPQAPLEIPPEALGSLSQSERDVLTLVAQDGELSYEALSARLGLSIDSVKGRLKRARQKMRAFFEAKEEDHEAR